MSIVDDNGVEAARPPRQRGTLSREEIVAAGLQIARTDDLNSLTMKRLADALHVTPMAVYRHFENKAEIIDAVLDQIVHTSDPTDHGIDPAEWQAWTRATFLRIHQSFLETPGAMGMIDALSRFGPGLLAVLDEILGVLTRAGFTNKQAVDAIAALISVTFGSLTIDTFRERSVDEIMKSLELAQSGLQDGQTIDQAFPALIGAAEDLLGTRDKSSVETSLDLMIAAIARWID